MNILIIKPSSLGDVVQALPVLKRLRDKFPRARIDWLVNQEYADILSGNPYLNTVHFWDRSSWRKPRRFMVAVRNAARIVRALRKARYDMVIDLQGLFRSGLIAFLSGGKQVIGFSDAREMAPIFYDKEVKAPVGEMQSVERYVLAACGDAGGQKESTIVLSEHDRRTTANLLSRMQYDESKPFVVLAPGARRATKQWPSENFAALSARLARNHHAQIAFVGSPSEALSVERIARLSNCAVMDFSGKTNLKQLACLLKMADVVVGNDSAPIHIAAAVGTPVVGLYGPTSPTRTGPYGSQHTVLTSKLKCSPCFSRTCDLSAQCMRDISVEAVCEVCGRYLVAVRAGKQKAGPER